MYVFLIAVGALWGAASGRLIPRAAYRLAVEPGEPWRSTCPDGHPITGVLGGWLGAARCTAGTVPAASAGEASAAPAAAAEQSSGAAGPAEQEADPAVAAAPAGPGDPAAPGDPAGAAHRTGPEAEPGAAAASAPPATPDGPAVPTSPAASGHPAYGPRTAVTVTVTAVLCALLAAAAGARPELAVWLLAAPFAVLLAVVDHRVHRLPDVLTLPLATAVAALLGIAALLPAHAGSWTMSLIGAVTLGAVYFALFVINSRGMGFGDVKLSLALGAALGWYGWAVLFLGFLAGLVLGGGYGLALLLLRRANRKSAIPLGPFMLSGAFLALLLGAV